MEIEVDRTVCTVSEVFDIKTSDLMGRYIIASKPIKAGDHILVEKPLVAGPYLCGSFFCLSCNKILESIESFYRCSECLAILCSASCQGTIGHSPDECAFLKRYDIFKTKTKFDMNNTRLINEALFHLRFLLLKKFDSNEWTKAMTLESHNDIRKNIPLHWFGSQFQIVDRIRKDWGIEEFTEEEIHTICGITKVNCFGFDRQGAKGRALYYLTSMFSHDCRPNARIFIDSKTFDMTVQAICDIAKDEVISISYVDFFWGTLQRRNELKNGKYFSCQCKRCSDPTELGTNCSGLRCMKCSDGIVLSTDSLNSNAGWSCLNCQATIDASTVSAIVALLTEELETIEPLDVISYQKFIQKYQKILSDNHCILLAAKYKLLQCPKSECEDAENYCRDLLNVLHVLEPGLSRKKGMILYKLYHTSVHRATKQLQKNEIKKKTFQALVKEFLNFLEDSEKILKIEPEGSMGKRMANEAKFILGQLEGNI